MRKINIFNLKAEAAIDSWLRELAVGRFEFVVDVSITGKEETSTQQAILGSLGCLHSWINQIWLTRCVFAFPCKSRKLSHQGAMPHGARATLIEVVRHNFCTRNPPFALTDEFFMNWFLLPFRSLRVFLFSSSPPTPLRSAHLKVILRFLFSFHCAEGLCDFALFLYFSPQNEILEHVVWVNDNRICEKLYN